MPLAVQPSAVCIPDPSVQAAGTTGLAPNQTERSECRFEESVCSIPLQAQFACGASACLIAVSAQPVAPSSGIVEEIGRPSDFRRFTWKGQEPEATTPSFLKSSIWMKASCQ